jgi:hypothetical protein
MSHRLPSPLPLFDRNLLRIVEKVVPRGEREEWSRAWEAELWHMHHCGSPRRTSIAGITADFSIGLTRDALWLRTESWRHTFSGTAILCLALLFGLLLFSTMVALILNGSCYLLGIYLRDPFGRFLLEAPLIFVTFAAASRSHIEQSSASRRMCWIRRQIFFAAKTTLTSLLAFMLSVNICWLIHAHFPVVAELLQTLFFVIFALIGLRWVFWDQERRCKHCLRSLATPARVGRPSHNLLEWNGTELICKHGHGLLSVPEMETSWCQSSQWIDQIGAWGETASI